MKGYKEGCNMNIKEMPLISIILPVFNSQEYISICIESILNQSMTNYQLIIVDDGSEDMTLSICKEYESKDKRIKVISLSNGGVSRARNIGLSYAVGEYVFFIDSDDYIHRQCLEILYNKAIECKSDLVIGNYTEVKFYNKSLITKDIDKITYIENEGRNILKQSYVYENTRYLAVWNKLIRIDIIESVKFPEDIAIGEDHYVCNILYYKSKNIILIDNVTYFYYVNNSNSITKSNLTIESTEQIKAYEKEYDYFNQIDNDIANEILKRILLTGIHLRYIAYKKENIILYKEIEKILSKYKYDKNYILSDSKMKIIKIYINFAYIYELKIILYKFYCNKIKNKKNYFKRIIRGEK